MDDEVFFADAVNNLNWIDRTLETAERSERKALLGARAELLKLFEHAESLSGKKLPRGANRGIADAKEMSLAG